MVSYVLCYPLEIKLCKSLYGKQKYLNLNLNLERFPCCSLNSLNNVQELLSFSSHFRRETRKLERFLYSFRLKIGKKVKY